MSELFGMDGETDFFRETPRTLFQMFEDLSRPLEQKREVRIQQPQLQKPAPTGVLSTIISQDLPRLPQERAVVLLDTCFLADIDHNCKAGKHHVSLPREFFSPFKLAIPSNVESEAKVHDSRGRPFVSNTTLNYLQSHLGVRTIKYRPSKDQVDLLLSIGRRDRFRITDAHDRRFESSGDLQMLAYAVARGLEPTIILSDNYGEIDFISHRLRRRQYANVYVIRPERIGIQHYNKSK